VLLAGCPKRRFTRDCLLHTVVTAYTATSNRGHHDVAHRAVADRPEVVDALQTLVAERQNPTLKSSLESTSRARSLVMHALLARQAQTVTGTWLVKVGAKHVKHIKDLAPLRANVHAFATEADFREAVPQFH